MAIKLSIFNNFELTSNGYRTISGKQGAIADADTVSLDLSTAGLPFSTAPAIAGTAHYMPGTLATATVVTAWDDDDDKPIDFDYLYYWADQDSYIQIIGSATNAVFKIMAQMPFTLSYDQIVAAANTTPIAGGTEPTGTDIDSIVIGNYSGNTMNYLFCVVD